MIAFLILWEGSLSIDKNKRLTFKIDCRTYVCRRRIVSIQFGNRAADKDDITTQVSQPCGYDFKPGYIT